MFVSSTCMFAGQVSFAVNKLAPCSEKQYPDVTLLGGGMGSGKSKLAQDLGAAIHNSRAWIRTGTDSAEAEALLSRRVEVRITFANGTRLLEDEKALQGSDLLAIRALYSCFPKLRTDLEYSQFFQKYHGTKLSFRDVVRCAVESRAAQLGVVVDAGGHLPPFFVTVVIDEAQTLLQDPDAPVTQAKPRLSHAVLVIAFRSQ